MSIDPATLADLGALQALRALQSGELTAVAYAQALLARVDQVEPTVQAWACLDRAHVIAQAQALDAHRRRGEPAGPLFGLPVGLKDIIDTRDLPTENGTVLHAGRRPRLDAEVVQRLCRAGGLVMGKTVTTELATYAPGKTRNPHDPQHTPGGSSSGSAAAVAAGMVPLAVGTQTNGSVIRPAAFCGVVGYKPSAGWLPRSGVLTQSPALDQLGVFARHVEDVALLVQVLAGDDGRDPATRGRAAPLLGQLSTDEPPPRLAWVRTPFWDRVDAPARAALEALFQHLGACVVALELPAEAAHAVDWHRTIMEADIARSFEREYAQGREPLSDSLRGQIERGRAISAAEYRQALAQASALAQALDDCFASVDAVVTPATLGTAPRGLASTGDPLMCTLWTLTGMPALSLPLLRGAEGLPLGVQLVGRRDDDARLLQCASWLLSHAAADGK